VDDAGEPEPLGARRVAWRPSDEPPVEEWRREGLAGAAGSAAADPTLVDPTTVPPPSSGAPNAGTTNAYEAPPTFDAPPPFEPTGPPEDPPGYNDQGPLPMRIPGQHLSHQPTPEREEVDVDADPMRPYRVHELLTRHAQGKRRGRDTGDLIMPTDPTMPESPESSVPDPFGHVQEDGR
jgi:hypothetical protein